LDDVIALVEAGADVNSAGDLGFTPLHHAASDGHLDIVHVLLRYGADVNARNEFAQTPIDLARDRVRETLELAKKASSQ
jgi:ankyrin repeat protein